MAAAPRPNGDIEEAAGLLAEEEFEWGETRGGLGNLPDAEQDVGQHSVPVAFVVSSHPTEHLLQRLVKSFHQPIGLWVVDCGAELLNLEKAAQVGHRPGHEGGCPGRSISPWECRPDYTVGRAPGLSP